MWRSWDLKRGLIATLVREAAKMRDRLPLAADQRKCWCPTTRSMGYRAYQDQLARWLVLNTKKSHLAPRPKADTAITIFP